MASMGIWLFAAFGRRADYSIRLALSASPKIVPKIYPKRASNRACRKFLLAVCPVSDFLWGDFTVRRSALNF